MKLVSVLLVALCIGTNAADLLRRAELSTEAPTAAPTDMSSAVQLAADAMAVSLTHSQSSRADLAAKCDEEIKATEAWIAEGSDLDDAERRAGREALVKALNDRVAGLEQLLKDLEGIKLRLKDHVVRSNTIYTTFHDMCSNEQQYMTTALSKIGFLVSDPKDPEWSPIVEPAVSAANAATGPAEATTTTPTVLLETATDLGVCSGEDCLKSASEAFTSYQTSWKDIGRNRLAFDSDKVTFEEFLEAVNVLIKLKTEKKANLMAQQQAVQAKLDQNTGSFAGDIFPKLKVHLSIIKQSCTASDGESAGQIALKGEIRTALDVHSPTAAASGASGAAA